MIKIFHEPKFVEYLKKGKIEIKAIKEALK